MNDELEALAGVDCRTDVTKGLLMIAGLFLVCWIAS